MTRIPSAAEAYYRQLPVLTRLKPRILSLCEAVGRPTDLGPYAWAQLMAMVLEFQPDLILELGRGYGNSTCAFAEAAHLLNQRPSCRVLSLCFADDWRVRTTARLQAVVSPEWFQLISALETDICTFDFAPVLASARRVALFWDAHGFEVASVVLGKIMPALADKPHLVMMHDLLDVRYNMGEFARFYGENPLWTGNNWSGPRVRLGSVESTVEQAIAAIDFTGRNRVTLHSADHSFHTGLTRQQQEEMQKSLGELYSLNGFWFYFSLNDGEPPFTFPRIVHKTSLSVLVCSHNPNTAHLTRALEALRQQTLPSDFWELLVIDSASEQPLADRFDLSWHPRARHLREEQVGKTKAFLRGLAASTGSILVIVDDDNVLAPDYLQQAVAIAKAHAKLGVWSGNVALQFEEPPPEWTRRYWPLLAEQAVGADRMVCTGDLAQPLPGGAGCCVRREAAEGYAAQLASAPWRQSLARTGKTLVACEDTDLVLTACEMGMFRGLFQSLRLERLIPPERLREEYLLSLVEGIQFSSQVLGMCRDSRRSPPPTSLWWRVKSYADGATRFGRKRRFYKAYKRAQRKARDVFETMQAETGRAAHPPAPG